MRTKIFACLLCLLFLTGCTAQTNSSAPSHLDGVSVLLPPAGSSSVSETKKEEAVSPPQEETEEASSVPSAEEAERLPFEECFSSEDASMELKNPYEPEPILPPETPRKTVLDQEEISLFDFEAGEMRKKEHPFSYAGQIVIPSIEVQSAAYEGKKDCQAITDMEDAIYTQDYSGQYGLYYRLIADHNYQCFKHLDRVRKNDFAYLFTGKEEIHEYVCVLSCPAEKINGRIHVNGKDITYDYEMIASTCHPDADHLWVCCFKLIQKEGEQI